MKNFFHYGRFDLGSAYDREIGSTNLECDKIQELLKTAYDYADHLYDRRFEQIESESRDGTEKAAKSEKQKKQRVQKLYQILDGVKDVYQSFSSSTKGSTDSNKLDILYHLTIGNICMRIEQWHLDNYHYVLADRWYGMATGALWQGINKVDALDSCPEDEQISIYHLLLRLNIGKCYRNFANQNRRSDFLAAKEKFQAIKEDIEKRLEDNDKMSREFALIWADASVNIARIYRHMYKMASAEEEFSYVLASLSAIDDSVIQLYVEDGRVTVEVPFNQTLHHKVILDNTSADTLISNSCTGTTETISNIFERTTQEDRKSIILQVLIEFGMLLRKRRRYFDAVYIFMAADFYDPECNIDAINNISSALRKYITTFDVNSSDIDNLIDQIQANVSDRTYTTLANQLKEYAVRGNLYASREFIRWHCDCYVNKNKGIKKWIGIDSVHPEKVLEQMGHGLDDIIKGYGAAYNDPNNYYIDGIIGRIDQLIQVNYEASKSYSEKYAEKNVQLLYLKGNVQLQFQCYDDAICTLRTVCERKEANYIRRGKLGLKTRYLLAQCYMAKAEFREALEILQGIRETLKSSFKSRKNSLPSDEKYSDAAPDFRVDRDYGYCLMQLGSYQKACEIYEEIEAAQRYKTYNQHQQVMSLNNYASCLIHMGDIGKAEEILKQAQAQSPNKKDKVTNLLLGYCFVCKDDRNTAQRYFDVAYGHDYDINPDIYGDAKAYAQRNKAKDQNVVEQRSAYIINLTKIWEVSDEPEKKERICKKIERFLSDISPACVLSLNATIALAEWLCNYESSLSKSSHQLMKRLYRSFASISVYPEHGSRAFKEFKDTQEFRYFQSNERGKILARLFVMYRHIKSIKEQHRFPLNDPGSEKTPSDHFFHYTNISTLKILLSEQAKDSELPPRFRVCNCGYMNDVFEGNVFLDQIRDIAVPDSESNSQSDKWNNMVRKYFPHLTRSEENMIPVSKNVYIASLSRNPDSFPLWSIYADNETGCNIEFSQSFFDILEKTQSPEQLQDYLISKYSDVDYPVYAIAYLGKKSMNGETILSFDGRSHIPQEDEKSDVFREIYNEWVNVDTEIEDLKKRYSGSPDDMLDSAISAIHSFTSDRINEVRFLFKDADYQYENEARVVVTTSETPQIDGSMSPPRVYAEVNRAIDNISVRLGSKIDDATVDQLVTWLKLTGKVREVKLSKRNRRTIDTSR